MIKAGVLLFVALLISGCQSVLFGNEIQKTAKRGETGQNVFRLYVDYDGNLYPPASLPVNNRRMRGRDLRADSLREVLSKSGLKEMYKAGADWEKAFFAYQSTPFSPKCNDGVKGVSQRDGAWMGFQNALWRYNAKLVREEAIQTGRPVVILAHGYNTKIRKAKKNYRLIQEKIQRHPEARKVNPIYVELFWDGGKLPIGSYVWSKAQATGSVVGFGFRQFLNVLSEGEGRNIPVRVIGHSSAAIIMTAALGDTTPVFPEKTYPMNGSGRCDWRKFDDKPATYKTYCLFEHRPSDYAEEEIPGDNSLYGVPVFNDYRVALLAAATPSTSLTGKCNSDSTDCRGGIKQKNVRLILANNPHDPVLDKYSGNCDRFGSTCLGIDGSSLSRVETRFEVLQAASDGNKMSLYRADFKDTISHDLHCYLRDPAMNPVISLLFEESVDCDDDLCKKLVPKSGS